jgi:hypothetical protein
MERGLNRTIIEVAKIYKNRIPNCDIEGAGFFDQRWYNLYVSTFVSSSEMKKFMPYRLKETIEWSHDKNQMAQDEVHSTGSQSESLKNDDVISYATNLDEKTARDHLDNAGILVPLFSSDDKLNRDYEKFLEEELTPNSLNIAAAHQTSKGKHDTSHEEDAVSTKRTKIIPTPKKRNNKKTVIGQFLYDEKFVKDISCDNNLKMAIDRIKETDRIRMEELHDRGLSLAYLFRIISLSDEGTLAERIYCFYAIDHFIGSNADSRIKPTRDENRVVCAMTHQFSNENTLVNHCKNRDLIDFIDLVKTRKESFCVGGFNFMEAPSAKNSKLFAKGRTLESESMLIYAHRLVTGELQPMEKTLPKDFFWSDLFNESGEDNSE